MDLIPWQMTFCVLTGLSLAGSVSPPTDSLKPKDFSATSWTSHCVPLAMFDDWGSCSCVASPIPIASHGWRLCSPTSYKNDCELAFATGNEELVIRCLAGYERQEQIEEPTHGWVRYRSCADFLLPEEGCSDVKGQKGAELWTPKSTSHNVASLS